MPGLNGTGCARNFFVHGSSAVRGASRRQSGASVWWPVDMRSRSRTRIAFRLAEGSAGASSGKNFSTSSSRLSFPSAIGEADGGGGEALAQRVEDVRGLGVVGRPPAFRDDVPVPHEHEAVHARRSRVGRLDEGEDGGGRDALLLRRAARERRSRRAAGPRPTGARREARSAPPPPKWRLRRRPTRVPIRRPSTLSRMW